MPPARLSAVNLHTLSLTDPEAAHVGSNISALWNDDGQLHMLSPGELIGAVREAQRTSYYLFTGGPQYAAWYAGVLERLVQQASLGAPLSKPRETEHLPLPGGGGPASVFFQAAAQDLGQLLGFELSNAVEAQFLP